MSAPDDDMPNLTSLFDTDPDESASSWPASRGAGPPPPPPGRPTRPAHGLCGLENQGATCYLNSLLQAMYMLPEMRCVARRR